MTTNLARVPVQSSAPIRAACARFVRTVDRSRRESLDDAELTNKVEAAAMMAVDELIENLRLDREILFRMMHDYFLGQWRKLDARQYGRNGHSQFTVIDNGTAAQLSQKIYGFIYDE